MSVDVQSLSTKAKLWASGHGVLMLSEDMKLAHGPFTLLPTAFPRCAVEDAKAIQPLLNKLVHAVSCDHDFLEESFRGMMGDDFVRRLFNIYEAVRNEGCTKPAVLGLHRSDYMLQTEQDDGSESEVEPKRPRSSQEPYTLPDVYNMFDTVQQLKSCSWPARQEMFSLKQIEINTISASFGGLVEQLPGLHRFVVGQLSGMSSQELQQWIPENPVILGLADGIAKAWQLYGSPRAVVLALVNENERNVFDQNPIEYHLLERYNVRLVRATLNDVIKHGRLSEQSQLIMWDDLEVAVAYLRSGYAPEHYPTEKHWEARLMMERSRCVTCPSAAYQLVGAKKIQQRLSEPGVLEQFVADPLDCRRLRAVFAGQWALSQDAAGDEASQMAIQNPEGFVMKPQREGGGNNFYGEQVRQRLLELADSEERNAYVLMERILPPRFSNVLIDAKTQAEEACLREIVSELGIYGVFVSQNDHVHLNTDSGHLLRSKRLGTDEGGVMVGASKLDTPLLL